MNPRHSPPPQKKKGIIPAILGVVTGLISSAVGVYFGYLRPIIASHGTINIPPGFIFVLAIILLGSIAGAAYLLLRKRKSSQAADRGW